MTLAQQLQVQRFNASALRRGVSVRLHPAGPLFTALVQSVPQEEAAYSVSKETRNFSRVFILRSAINADGVPDILIGATFINQETQESYRVASYDDNAADVRVIYHCETSSAN